MAQFWALVQVLFIDVALAGDNALIVGLAVAGLPAAQRKQAMLVGVLGAAVLRILLALVALRLLAVIGLTLAGGLLLLWVCWRMGRELRSGAASHKLPQKRTLRQAVMYIVMADFSMSLDNVLAVAGAAHGHWPVLVCGLAVSVLLMGLAANAIARLLARLPSIAWAGLAIVFYVAVRMIWDGVHQVGHHFGMGHL